MDYIVIEGVHPYDGRYEFDLEGRPFNTREWGWIKRWSGFTMLTIGEGWRALDPELLTTFAVIAVVRAGKADKAQGAQVYEQAVEVSAGFGTGKAITIETDVEEKVEDDAGPPPESSSSNGEDSVPSSSPSSVISAPSPRASGTHGSVSSMSPSPRSAS